MVFLIEHAPEGRRGVMGALASCGACAGILLGSAVGAGFAGAMSAEALNDWGWRIPFLVGLLVGIAGYFVRRHMTEVPVERPKRAPLVETLHDHWRVVLAFAGLSVFNAVSFYVTFVYLVSWLQMADGIAPARALEINTISMVVLLFIGLAVVRWTDHVGRKPALLLATILGFVAALPLFWLMHQQSAALAQLGQLGLVLIIGLFVGAQPAFMVESAPASVRCTTVALGYNICLGVIGGLTPLVATWLVDRTGDELAPAFLIMASAAVTFLVILRMPETYRRPLPGLAVTST